MPGPAASASAGRRGVRRIGESIRVEVTRSGWVESVHEVRAAVVEADGTVVLARGDVDSPVFGRSSNKPAQAAAMLEVGLAATGELLALAGASHSGQPFHVEAVRRVLAGAGLTEDDLQCPPDLPGHDASRLAVVRSGGGPLPVYMNCSGKHASMLASAVAAGWPTSDYRDPEHPLQRHITATIARLTGEQPTRIGVDGCGAPAHAVSLRALARLGAAAVTAARGTPERAVADAYRSFPAWMSGTGRDDELWMTSVPGLFSKGGAEGVLLLGFPDGRGLAVKVVDGNPRAAAPAAVAVLAALGLDVGELDGLATRPTFGAGLPVGEIRVSGPLS